MHFPYAITVSAVFGCIAIGQTLIDLKTQSKSVDFTAASTTKPFKSGVVLPPVCSVSETFFKTDALPGSNWYACTALNTWTLQSGGVMTGDVNGPATSNVVNQIQGRPVSAAAPSSGQTLVWSGVNNRWEPGSGGSGLSVKINGGAALGPQATLNFIPGMGFTGYSAVVNGSQIDITQALDTAYLNTRYIQVATLAALGTGLLKNTTTGVPSIAVAGDIPDLSATYSTKTASGDLSGTLPSPTVAKIQGKATDTPTTKGDLFVYDGSAIKRLGVGSDNHVLTADAAQATGVKWAAPGGGSTGYPGAGFGVSTGSAWGTSRTIAPGTGITVTNGDGVSGNPTIAADTAVILSKAANASGTDLYVSDTSGNTTYAGCPATYTIAAYSHGMRINFRPNTSSTTTATLNLCTLGTKWIFQSDGTTDPATQLVAKKFYTLTYDSTLATGAGAWRMTQGDSAAGGSYVPTTRTVNGHALSNDIWITASDVSNGTAQWNANQLQGRAMASTAPADTNVICWDNAGNTWKPCAAGAGAGFPATATALTLDNTGSPSANRQVTPRYGITGTDGGATSTYTLDTGIDARRIRIEEYWCGGQGNATYDLGWYVARSQSGSNIVKADGDYPTPCGKQLQSGTTVGNGTAIGWITNMGNLGNHTNIKWHVLIKFKLSTTSNAVMYVGIADNPDQFLAGSGFLLRYSTDSSDTAFMFNAKYGAVDHVLTSGVAADTNLHTLHLYGDGTTNNKVYFQLDGGTPRTACAVGCDITANIYTGLLYPGMGVMLGTGGTATVNLSLYYFGYEMPLSTGTTRFSH